MSVKHPTDRTTSLIVRDPDVLGGRPVFRGTRVPVDVLFGNLADGLTLGEILSTYPTLDRDDAVSALELARRRLLDDAARGVSSSMSACRCSCIDGAS